jgi:signal peptidase I
MDKFKKIYIKLANFSNSWVGTIVIVSFVIFFIAQAFIIPTGSMKSTLLIGDGLFGKKFSYGTPIPRIPWLEVAILPDLDGDGHLFNANLPKRGDIVIFRYPLDDKLHYVKRLVAVGGDLLMMKNKTLYLRPNEGNKYINENYPKENIVEIDNLLWVKNPYISKYKGINYDGAIFPEPLVNFTPIKIPKDEYFMMGDNRDHSNDSRFWGSVPYKYIVGTPWFIYFSWENRDYLTMLNSNDSKDIDLLSSKCGKININDSRCRDIWNKYQYSIRWDRMFKFINKD